MKLRQTSLRVASLISTALLIAGAAAAGCSARLPVTVERDASIATFQWLDEQYGIVRDPEADAMLQRIGARLDGSVLGRALEHECEAAVDGALVRYPWQIFILRSPSPNAFSLGAGIIFVTTGLVEQTNTESELAAVIAHEMAHQLLGHTREAIAAAAEEGDGFRTMPSASFSLERELEADDLSVKMLSVARYQPQAAIRALSIGHTLFTPQYADTRPVLEPVSQSEWLEMRVAKIHERLSGCSKSFPATDSTREFRRVRRLIASLG